MDILAKLVKIANEIFEITTFSIDRSMDNTPEWDSLNNLQLLTRIEKEFGKEFQFEQTLKMTSAKTIVDLLSQ